MPSSRRHTARRGAGSDSLATMGRSARLQGIILVLTSGLAGLAPGCAQSPIYDPAENHPIGNVSQRHLWRLGGDLKDPAKAADGDLATAATDPQRRANATLTIDLGKPCVFNLVIVDHGLNQYGFCRRMVVLTSMDGQTFTQRHAVPGTRRVTAAMLPEFVLARYIRLQAATPGDRPWSIAEVYIQ
jgi:hypothetical protein